MLFKKHLHDDKLELSHIDIRKIWNKSRHINVSAYMEKRQIAIFYGVYHLIWIVILFLSTEMIKRMVKRIRPALFSNDRKINIRKNEGKLCFPNGDMVQVTFWTLFILQFFNNPLPLFLIFLVGFSRVYYQCNWIGDVIGGFLIGAHLCIIAMLYHDKAFEVFLDEYVFT